MTRLRNVLGPAVLLASIFAAGCESPEAALARHLKRGDAYVEQRSLKEAIIEYASAVKADPKSGVARRKLAETYVQNQQYGLALDEYVRAADLLADDSPLQITAGQMLLLAGRFDDAIGRAQKVLDKEPRNTEALILKGNGLAKLKNIDGALDEIEDAIRSNPASSIAYANMGLVQYARGEIGKSEAAFKSAIAADQKSVLPRLSLVNLYWASGRLEDAERTLKEALAIDATNSMVNRTLALFYITSGRMADAEKPLKAVIAKEPHSNARFTLADYYVLSQRVPAAKAILEETAKDDNVEFATAAKLRLAALGFAAGDLATTHQLIEEVLKRNPRHTQALITKAQILQAEGKRDEATATIRLAVKNDPTSAQANYVLGKLLAGAQQYEDAMSALKESLKADTRFTQAEVELARLSLMAGRHADAVSFAQSAVRNNPNRAEAYLVLAQAQISSGNPEAAEAPLKILLNSLPDNAVIQSELGRLQLAKGDLAGARQSFQRALAKDAAQVSALQGLIAIDFQQGNQVAARTRVEKALASQPNNHALQVLVGRTYLSLGDFAAAERALKQALVGEPTDLEAYGLLATIYFRQNRLPEATAEFEKLSKLQPKSVSYQTMVGTLLHLQQKTDAAKAQYEKVLALDRGAPVAANNLAQLYSDRNENLDLALSLAQTAKSGMPGSHEVDDTLGWLYYKKGNASMAIGPLRSAVAAQPNNAVYLYHLGAAYALNKDRTNARQTLEKALRQAPFDGADDARRLLDSLK